MDHLNVSLDGRLLRHDEVGGVSKTRSVQIGEVLLLELLGRRAEMLGDGLCVGPDLGEAPETDAVRKPVGLGEVGVEPTVHEDQPFAFTLLEPPRVDHLVGDRSLGFLDGDVVGRRQRPQVDETPLLVFRARNDELFEPISRRDPPVSTDGKIRRSGPRGDLVPEGPVALGRCAFVRTHAAPAGSLTSFSIQS
jgi:hypothetical protein